MDASAPGLILFAHGARDARWAEPFVRLRDLVAAGTTGPVELAYLELMKPDLAGAVQNLVAHGCTAVVVVPVFLGQGGHVRQDLPAQIERIRSAYPQLSIDVVKAAGEDANVLGAIARYCLQARTPRQG